MWRIIFLFCLVHLSNAAFIRCFDKVITTYDVVSLNDAPEILESPYYDSSCPNVFFTFGFRGKTDGPAVNSTINALLKFKTTTCINVFLLDWMREASSTSLFGDIGIKVAYATKAVPLAIAVAKQFGAALINLAKYGFSLAKTHLIGFSLGAQLYGYTGLYVNDHGDMIDRITGLDPAGPLFGGDLTILHALDKTCAKFVVIIHTDAGGYGINESLAHIDIWPNFNNFIKGTEEEQVQPGCPVGNFAFMSKEDICSHDRSWMLMSEAITMDTLQASKADNQYAWNAGNTSTIINLTNIDRNARGDFFLVTNPESPYGIGSDGLHL